MEKKDRLPKPLMECEVLPSLHKERSERKRGTVPSEKEEEERILALKDWSHYSYIRHHNELWKQDRIYLTQQTALSELKKVKIYYSSPIFTQSLIAGVFGVV